MSEWKEFRLCDVADVQTGPFGSQLHQSDYQLTGTPIITVEHLGDNRIVHNNLPLVSDVDKERLKKYTLMTGDVVFSRVGSVDRCAYVHESEDGWMFSGRLLRVRAIQNHAFSRFLSFYFSQESFKETIRMIAVGATMPSINTEILSNVDILLPPLPEQKAIAGVLSSLDDKIYLLQRQNKTLEGMAEALWRKMFVEDADDSWKIVKMSDIIEVRDGTHDSPKQTEFGFPLITSRHLKSEGIDFANSYNISGEDYIQINKRSQVEKDDLLFSMIGTLGLIHYVEDIPNFAIKNIGLFKSSQKPEFAKFLYLLLKSPIGKDFIFENADGSTQEYISLGNLRGFSFQYPGDKAIKDFNSTITPYFEKIFTNKKQIRKLISLRESLLSKLMSGEVMVKV